MKRLSPVFSRLWHSAVVWSWAFSALRLSTGLFLLPLLLRLPAPDFGFYYVLLSLTALVSLLDLGFAASFDRALGYAMSGATELKSQGTATSVNGSRTSVVFPATWSSREMTSS